MVLRNSSEGHRIRVMLVDESALFLSAATFFLKQYPDVEIVGTLHRGDQAVAQAQTLKPEIILLDLSLPGLPGVQVISRLRAVMPEIKVIVLTLLDVGAFRQAALAAGAAVFVSKVNARTELLSAIRSVAQAEQTGVQDGSSLDASRFQDWSAIAKGGSVYGPSIQNSDRGSR